MRRAQFRHPWMGWPEHMIFFGQGMGDDRLCTAVARESKKRGPGKIAMLVSNDQTAQLISWLTLFLPSQS